MGVPLASHFDRTENGRPVARPPLLSSAGAILVGWLCLSCGSASDDAMPVDAGPPPPATLVFHRDGVPGPWWREAATQELFDAEHRVCLARSREARASAGEDGRADAAYRSFLECMKQTGWTRGLPPSA